MDVFKPLVDFRSLYDRFNAPIAGIDCGQKCAPHNLAGKPFCCDICQAVPALYRQEWDYLQPRTDLWHVWCGDECAGEPAATAQLEEQMPEHMLLLACLGPERCQRAFRSVSCRQFPFFPYVTADFRFIGLAYDWEFEQTCWVISNLGEVTDTYRHEFVQAYDALFELWPEEMESYAVRSEMARAYFAGKKRRIPILHRNGKAYLLSPGSERLRLVSTGRFQRYGPYRM